MTSRFSPDDLVLKRWRIGVGVMYMAVPALTILAILWHSFTRDRLMLEAGQIINTLDAARPF